MAPTKPRCSSLITLPHSERFHFTAMTLKPSGSLLCTPSAEGVRSVQSRSTAAREQVQHAAPKPRPTLFEMQSFHGIRMSRQKPVCARGLLDNRSPHPREHTRRLPWLHGTPDPALLTPHLSARHSCTARPGPAPRAGTARGTTAVRRPRGNGARREAVRRPDEPRHSPQPSTRARPGPAPRTCLLPSDSPAPLRAPP